MGMQQTQTYRVIQGYNTPYNTSRRYDCPFCGGKNTLSITNADGHLKWLCFRASCGVKGNEKRERTSAELKQVLGSHKVPAKPFEVPAWFTSVASSDKAIKYLEDNHVMDAYVSRRADIRFDPRQQRVVFMVGDMAGSIIDGAGRSLTGAVPKWYRYGHSGEPFICGSSPIAVVVEDCASACAVSGVATGVALLGTNLQQTMVSRLRKFEGVIVALDYDAKQKALRLRDELSFYVPTRMVILDDDLKYYDEPEIRKILRLPS